MHPKNRLVHLGCEQNIIYICSTVNSKTTNTERKKLLQLTQDLLKFGQMLTQETYLELKLLHLQYQSLSAWLFYAVAALQNSRSLYLCNPSWSFGTSAF